MELSLCEVSSVGRARALQARGHWFEPSTSHHFLTGISSVGLERTPDKRKVSGSSPECPTNDMESEPNTYRPIPQIIFIRRYKRPPGSLYRSIRTISVVVTSVSSKHLWRVRVPYGAPIVEIKLVHPSGLCRNSRLICVVAERVDAYQSKGNTSKQVA